QALQVDPVVLVGAGRRQRRTRHPDFGAAHRVGGIAVLDTGQRGDDALGGLASARALEFALGALRRTQDPGLVAEDAARRIGKGFELEFAAHAEGAVDPAQEHALRRSGLLRGRRLHRGIRKRGKNAGRAARGPRRQAAAAALLALYRSATLSLICAPWPSQCSTRSTLSSTRFSAPEATGLK